MKNVIISVSFYLMSFLLPIICNPNVAHISIESSTCSLVQYIPPNHTHTHTHIYPYSQKYLAEPSYLFFSPNLPLPSSSLRVIKIPMRIPSLYQLEIIEFPPPPQMIQMGKKKVSPSSCCQSVRHRHA